MNKIDEMLRMAEITDMKDIPVASKKKNELGMLMKPKILHRGHVKKAGGNIYDTAVFRYIRYGLR